MFDLNNTRRHNRTSRRPDPRAARRPDRLRPDHPGMEQLETRILLDSAPIPPLSALDNPINPVVRVETPLGDIDMELFSNAAPQIVADFLANLNRYPSSAFTRVVPGQILQAGQVLDPTFYTDEGRLRQLATTDTATVPNTARTIGAVNFGATNDAVTPEFYINLSDNPELDTGPGAGIVFARILDDRSWDVVQMIAGLPTADLDEQLLDPALFAGPFIDVQGPFNDVPFRAEFFDPEAPLANSAAFVGITDSQLLKPGNVDSFFTDRVYYPEGFIGGEDINEFVPIANPNNEPMNYQVILRREAVPGPGALRDLVIDAGQIAANSRGGVDLTTAIRDLAQNGQGDPVFDGEPYAIEVWATGPVSANLSHFDFGTATGEAFTDRPATTWNFAETERGDDLFSFLVWQNTTGELATVDVTFFTAQGDPTTISVFTPPHQRGGLSIAELSTLPEGTLGIRVEADQEIVAALSRYATEGADQGGSTELGVIGDGTAQGVLPLGTIGEDLGEGDFRQFASFFNPGDSPAVVTLISRGIGTAPGVGDPVERTLNIPAGGSVRFNFADISEEIGANSFSAVFDSTQPVIARASHTGRGDVTAAALSNVGAESWVFAEGFMDPARAGDDLFESVAVFNPGAGDTTATMIFRFTDGTQITQDLAIPAGRSALLDIHAFQPLLDEAAVGRNFYSIEVAADQPVVAHMRRYDLTLGDITSAAGGFGTLGQPVGPLTPINIAVPA